MRYAVTALLMLAVLAMGQGWAGTPPIGKNGVNSLYVTNWLDYMVQESNAGIVGYRETALGADTLYVTFDLPATYDHGELYIQFTADAANGNYAATKTTRNVAVYWVPTLTYTSRTETAGHKLSIANMNSDGDVIEYVYRTLVEGTADKAANALVEIMIGNISGRTGESTGVIGPFWLDSDGTATTCCGFKMITADTVGVSWRALLIPRT